MSQRQRLALAWARVVNSARALWASAMMFLNDWIL